MLNPSKFKEYPLHCVGLGWLNKFNIIPEYTERFTHIDELELKGLHHFSRLYIQRKGGLTDTEKELLEKEKFRFVDVWGTLMIDLTKPFSFSRNLMKNVLKGERNLTFEEVLTMDGLKEYHELLCSSRKQNGFKTASFEAFKVVWDYQFYPYPHYYHIFLARQEGKVVAGMGILYNDEYAFEFNLARDKTIYYAQDYLKYKVLEQLKENEVKWYDLAGINPDPEFDSKDLNIRKYKEKWGKEFYYVFEYKR